MAHRRGAPHGWPFGLPRYDPDVAERFDGRYFIGKNDGAQTVPHNKFGPFEWLEMDGTIYGEDWLNGTIDEVTVPVDGFYIWGCYWRTDYTVSTVYETITQMLASSAPGGQVYGYYRNQTRYNLDWSAAGYGRLDAGATIHVDIYQTTGATRTVSNISWGGVFLMEQL